MSGVFIRRAECHVRVQRHTDTAREECHVTTEADIGVLQLYAKEHQDCHSPPDVRKKQGRVLPLRESMALLPP